MKMEHHPFLIARCLAAMTIFGAQAVFAHDPSPNAVVCAKDLEETGDPFTSASSSGHSYVRVYDLIRFLPIYRESTDLHVRWIESVARNQPLMIDVGGGSGNMAIEGARTRPDARIHIVDKNPGMLALAAEKGLPRSRLHLSDATDLRIGGVKLASSSVDHVFSHSLMWDLPDPEAFVAEVARVLRPGGTFALSTALPLGSDTDIAFADYVNFHLSIAERVGLVSLEQRRAFLSYNRRLSRAVKHPFVEDELKRLGARFGLEIEEAHPAYVVNTSLGLRPLFIQLLFRKI